MSFFKFIKEIFVIRNTPKQSEIVVSSKNSEVATILLWVGVLFLPIGFSLAVYKTLVFNGFRVKVDEFVFTILLLSLVIALISATKTMISLINAHSNYLRGIKERRLKIAGSILASYSFTIYMAFFSVNEAYLLGLYNERAHVDVCKIYIRNASKTDVCIEYEKTMGKDTSLMGRAFYFLN